ncbi:MAG: patatin-like phospholipase family protein [Rhizobiaceae bacterium]|nr:patatin-like phospholipase family protein [Rhizobiaceae bacterium]
MLALALAVGGCAVVKSGPINRLIPVAGPATPDYLPPADGDGSVMVGLAFSGGGTRATAFAYGVLKELESHSLRGGSRRTLLDEVRVVSGSSGGAIAAAYFAYKGSGAYHDLHERFLMQDAEASLRTAVSPSNLVRLVKGGINDETNFPRWLNDNLFDGATYANLRRPDAPRTWITATDLFHGTHFLFNYDTFAALCSDLDSVRLADAVAASAAVPGVFYPVKISLDGPGCAYQQPEWVGRSLSDPEAPLRLRAYSRMLDAYARKREPKFVRLVDGGLTDNTAAMGFVLSKYAARNLHGPLSAAEAVNLKTMIYIAADADTHPALKWGDSSHGPRLPDLAEAVVRAGIASSMRSSYDVLNLAVKAWRDNVVAFRCSLSRAEVLRLRRSLAGWNCRDLRIVVEHVSFLDADPHIQPRLNEIPTRLVLKEDEVSLTIEAGRQALRNKQALRQVISSVSTVRAPIVASAD